MCQVIAEWRLRLYSRLRIFFVLVCFNVTLLVMGNHVSSSDRFLTVRAYDNPPEDLILPNFSFNFHVNRKIQDNNFFDGVNSNGISEDKSSIKDFKGPSEKHNDEQKRYFENIFKSFRSKVGNDDDLHNMINDPEGKKLDSTAASFMRKELEEFDNLPFVEQLEKVIQLKKGKAKWKELSPGFAKEFQPRTTLPEKKSTNPIDDMPVEDLERLVDELRRNPEKAKEYSEDETNLTDEEKARRNKEMEEFMQQWAQMTPEMKKVYFTGEEKYSPVKKNSEEEKRRIMEEKYKNHLTRWNNMSPEMKEKLRNEVRRRSVQSVYSPSPVPKMTCRQAVQTLEISDESSVDVSSSSDEDDQYAQENLIQNDHNELNELEEDLTNNEEDTLTDDEQGKIWKQAIQTEEEKPFGEGISEEVGREPSIPTVEYVKKISDMLSGGLNDLKKKEFKSLRKQHVQSADNNRVRREAESSDKTSIKEGLAEILFPTSNNVFYNKVQEFNRDMSVVALSVFSEMYGWKTKIDGENNETNMYDRNLSTGHYSKPGIKYENGITILEPLSASGLRSIRYAKEVPRVKQILASDLSEHAVDNMKENVKHNHVEELVSVTRDDANLVMYKHLANEDWIDVIDIDPFGSPSRFLEMAVRTVRNGGMLMVTCTDMPALAGSQPDQCFVNYNAFSLRSPACHEMALRIVLQNIQSQASKYNRYIVPLLSFSADFYIRVMVQIYTSSIKSRLALGQLALVYQCAGCKAFTVQPLASVVRGANSKAAISLVKGPPVDKHCDQCGKMHNLGGPIWAGALSHNAFVEKMLKLTRKKKFATSKRMEGMLSVILKELPDQPLYYNIDDVINTMQSPSIPHIKMKSAILNAGYRVSPTHIQPTAIKTDAPAAVIFDIIKSWMKYAALPRKKKHSKIAEAILSKPQKEKADFSIHPDAQIPDELKNLVRYQINPEKFWGPGTRPKLSDVDETTTV